MENWNTFLQASLNEPVPPVLVRVVSQSGSAPRTAGARMLVRQHDVVGTVGGGQYEYLAIETARGLQKEYAGGGVTRSGIIRFSLAGVEDMDMICGGELCLLLELLGPESLADEVAEAAARAEKRYKDFCLISLLAPLDDTGEGRMVNRFLEGLPQGVFVPLRIDTAFYLAGEDVVGANYPELFKGVTGPAAALKEPGFIDMGRRQSTEDARDDLSVTTGTPCFSYCFADPFLAPPVIHIFGGGHVSKALADCLAPLSLGVVVLEDRAEFIAQERFPQAKTILLPSLEHEVIREYLHHVSPEHHHGIVIMTRGHAYDREVLAAALDSGAGYIGMIGSKRKWIEVQRSLLASGVSETALRRVYTPIGLSIGAETPEEIAVSIAAEIIAWRRDAGSET